MNYNESMADSKYSDSEEYQKQIAEGYKKRSVVFSTEEIARVFALLGIQGIEPTSISQATSGNVNATYLTADYVIKINKNKEHRSYLPNKIISDALGASAPIVKVVAYDFFEKTPYEVLVMARSPGTVLLDDIFDLSEAQQIALFKQVLGVIKKGYDITFPTFGRINLESESFSTYTAYLKHEFSEYMRDMRKQKIGEESDIQKLENYFYKHVGVFDDETSVFVHTDIHPGNILHEGDHLTAVIDFDSSIKAPKVRTMVSLLGLIENPQQFVEGTDLFSLYKGKKFLHFLPTLVQEFPDVFNDSQLLLKLNLLGLKEGLMWVADNWSEEWNKEMITRMLKEEIPETKEGLHESYYGRILLHNKI